MAFGEHEENSAQWRILTMGPRRYRRPQARWLSLECVLLSDNPPQTKMPLLSVFNLKMFPTIRPAPFMADRK
jgi:hypothetical protein